MYTTIQGYSLSSTKNLKNSKIWSLNIFLNSKNQILNNWIIEGKKGLSMLGELPWIFVMSTMVIILVYIRNQFVLKYIIFLPWNICL